MLQRYNSHTASPNDSENCQLLTSNGSKKRKCYLSMRIQKKRRCYESYEFKRMFIKVDCGRLFTISTASTGHQKLSYSRNSPGYSSAEEPKRTQSPVSKFADLQVAFLLQSSMQSVSMRVPGRESSMSSGAGYT